MADKMQVITHNDTPVAVVIPYEEYKQLVRKAKFHSESHKYAVPQEVAELVLVKEYTPIKAWRTHLGLSQKEMASRLTITQGAFSQIENSRSNQMATLKKVAAAFGIHTKQLQLTE